MPVRVRLDPPALEAPAGSDVDGDVVLENPGDRAVHVRLVVSGEAGGWASVEPPDVELGPGEERRCLLRFRLPRGAPGGVGAIPFFVRVLSDDGEGGATASGEVDIVGQAELAVRILPGTTRGTRSARAKVAVDNLGDAPARVQFEAASTGETHVDIDPDSVVIDAGTTQFAHVHVRPRDRFLSGEPRTHRYTVSIEPMGGARVSAEGAMVQRSLLAGFGPRVVLALAAVAVLGFAAVRVAGGGGDGSTVSAGRATTATVATTTTSADTTTTAAAPAGSAPPGAPSTTMPAAQRRIAFQTQRDGNYEIYSAAPDGTSPQNLTRDPSHDGEPAWSPDHTRIAFDSDRGGNFDIYVMNADGSSPEQLTHEPAPDGYPAWSPDGTKIAFTSLRDGNSEIYVMNADGSDERRLTKNIADDSHPTWSPDGAHIAFHTDRDGNYEVYAMNADGSDQHDLSNNPAADKDPSWAPNGARLAFDSTRDGGAAELYLMGADGSLPTRLTTNDVADAWPSWSPDGTHLAFQSLLAPDPELYTMPAGGGKPKRITDSPGEDAEPAWAP